ncbi:hypothetical protein NA57DRAFT_35977 [Rhizodiscina lignyota]|uniref:Zn(2)-C6 fungal-type domain-containing protein n=1 Tax=Rhizodiscina lignyota TaxID=1504668 RepID=A0A9P4M871_9PEZI|nr:hypothetical protein NA57DRAFT_35977 [Rhizodiscina lignyota]
MDESTRRDRAAIAAQACETCRSRKSRCDEGRPKCGSCQRLGMECKYREPQPTKKDKSLEYLLAKMKELTQKVDRMQDLGSKMDAIGVPISPSTTSNSGPVSTHSVYSVASSSVAPVAGAAAEQPPIPQRVLAWPKVTSLLISAGWADFENMQGFQLLWQGAIPQFLQQLEMNQHLSPLPSEPRCHTQAHPTYYGREIIIGLSPEMMNQYADLYYSTLGVRHPLLSREEFDHAIMPIVAQTGFGYNDCLSITALLVFALGKLSFDGMFADPVRPDSGIRGGSVAVPPGLELFNEARKRIGFIGDQCDLETVRMYLLLGLYYESCFRHIDYWRSSINASICAQALLGYNSSVGDSERLLSAYCKVCKAIENSCHFVLGLPMTAISEYEELVAAPGMNELNANPTVEQRPLQMMVALLNLHRIVAQVRSHTVQCKLTGGNDLHARIHREVTEISNSLESWRRGLPHDLHWKDADRLANLAPSAAASQGTLSYIQSPPDLRSSAMAETIQIAHFRSWYYYARHMMFRPFLFKALHSPESMTAQDCLLAAHCLQAALLWPIAMQPCANMKRVVPSLFNWTYSFVELLLILRTIRESEMLGSICDQYLDAGELSQTVFALHDWVKDMSQVDGLARWASELMAKLYPELYFA